MNILQVTEVLFITVVDNSKINKSYLIIIIMYIGAIDTNTHTLQHNTPRYQVTKYVFICLFFQVSYFQVVHLLTITILYFIVRLSDQLIINDNDNEY